MTKVSTRSSWLLFAVGLLAAMPLFGQGTARPVAPAQLCVDDDCNQTPAATSATGAIKWHPGHYVSFIPSKFPTTNYKTLDRTPLTQILEFLDEIADEPTIQGIQVFGYWGEFEGSKPGDYAAGFATMDAILARAKLRGKYVMLNIMGAVFGGYPSDWTFAFPDYLVQPSQGGTDSAGTFGISVFNKNGSGLQARIWQPATSDRVIALKKAYGARYNSHPNFEMMTIGETSVNLVLGTDGYTREALDRELRRQLTATKAAFPNTGVRIGANFYSNEAGMISLVNFAGDLGLAIGGPDVLPNNVIWANQAFSGAYEGSTDWRGVVPFVAEVQDPELGGKEGTYTNQQLYLAAMKGISTASNGQTGSGNAVFRATEPQYFVWYYNTWSGGPEQKWSTGTLPFIRSINGAVASTTCPSGYKHGCRSN